VPSGAYLALPPCIGGLDTISLDSKHFSGLWWTLMMHQGTRIEIVFHIIGICCNPLIPDQFKIALKKKLRVSIPLLFEIYHYQANS
jgi:hypothetical protein